MKGDHYASVMFRCKVNFQSSADTKDSEECSSIIIKTLPEKDCIKRDLLMNSKLFETEIEMYSNTLRKLESILEKHGEPTKFSAA